MRATASCKCHEQLHLRVRPEFPLPGVHFTVTVAIILGWMEQMYL